MVLLPPLTALLDLFSGVCDILYWNMDKSNGCSEKWFGQKQYSRICGLFGCLSVVGRVDTVHVHYLVIIMLIDSLMFHVTLLNSRHPIRKLHKHIIFKYSFNPFMFVFYDNLIYSVLFSDRTTSAVARTLQLAEVDARHLAVEQHFRFVLVHSFKRLSLFWSARKGKG